jgi:amino acid transporter
MLAIEGITVLATVALAIYILSRGGAHGITFTPFTTQGTTLSGIGLATVFALLSFVGFEGAAVLGAESVDPTRTIPRAIATSVIIAGVLFVFVVFAQQIGYGADARGAAAFAATTGPLADLASRYTNPTIAALMGGGAAVSAFAATLGSGVAAARLAFSLARDARLPVRLASVHDGSGTPAFAFLIVIAISAVINIGFTIARTPGADIFNALGAIATLALIVIYGAVQVSALKLFRTHWTPLQRAIPIVALLFLGATFVANVFPVPSGWAASYPYIVLVWLLSGAVLMRSRSAPRETRPSHPDR